MEQPVSVVTGVVIVAAVHPSSVQAVISRSGYVVSFDAVVSPSPLTTVGAPILMTIPEYALAIALLTKFVDIELSQALLIVVVVAVPDTPFA